MRDNVSDIATYYNNNAEHEHQRLQRHQLEYELTLRYLNQNLPAQGSILEVGAATGRYTLALARKGYAITAVDMSEKLLDECRKNIAAEGLETHVRFVLADARDLSPVIDKTFDAVLLMGPLYHLIHEADRKLALQQAFDRLRDGGIIFSAFISRFGIFGDVVKNVPHWIENPADVRSLLEKGREPVEWHPDGFRGYFATVSEIAPLHEAIGFETITLVGVEPGISAEDESYNRLEGKQRQLWQDLFYEIGGEPTIIGASRHLLYIGKKKI